MFSKPSIVPVALPEDEYFADVCIGGSIFITCWQSTPSVDFAADVAFIQRSSSFRSLCFSIASRTLLERTFCKPIVPISKRERTLPSTYNPFSGNSLISEALTTFGCVIKVSEIEAKILAAGVASPA